MLKSEIRILGFDDGPFDFDTKSVIVVGAISRGGKYTDGILKTDVRVDGTDATEKIARLINKSRHKRQLRVVMFDGITLGGFNIVDLKKLHELTELPIIAINRKIPDLKKVRSALRRFKDYKKRWQMIENAGVIKECRLKNKKKVYYQNVGIDDDEAEDVILLSSTRSDIPEPLRIAHLIATGVIKGESAGRA